MAQDDHPDMQRRDLPRFGPLGCQCESRRILISVNADVTAVETISMPRENLLVNDLCINGLGERGNAGLDAAVTNAGHHATGVQMRELPIRIEKLLA